MTVSDMNIASLLDVFDYALVLIYGLALDVFISGGCDTPRQKRLIAYLCPCFLVVQLLGWLTLGELAVKQIYPLIVHLPLVLILVLALKSPGASPSSAPPPPISAASRPAGAAWPWRP